MAELTKFVWMNQRLPSNLVQHHGPDPLPPPPFPVSRQRPACWAGDLAPSSLCR